MVIPMETIGKLMIGAGAVLTIVGVGVRLFAKQLSWLGNLPGDIKIQRPGFSLYIPLTTMLVLNLGVSFITRLIRRIPKAYLAPSP